MPRIHPRWQLAQCDLEELPALIGGFYLLRLLDLSENKLEELPPDIGGCYTLQTLNISSNQIKALPDEMRQLIHLKDFKFYSNQIVVLPDWIGELPLTALNGFNNRILHFPDTLEQPGRSNRPSGQANPRMGSPSRCDASPCPGTDELSTRGGRALTRSWPALDAAWSRLGYARRQMN